MAAKADINKSLLKELNSTMDLAYLRWKNGEVHPPQINAIHRIGLDIIANLNNDGKWEDPSIRAGSYRAFINSLDGFNKRQSSVVQGSKNRCSPCVKSTSLVVLTAITALGIGTGIFPLGAVLVPLAVLFFPTKKWPILQVDNDFKSLLKYSPPAATTQIDYKKEETDTGAGANALAAATPPNSRAEDLGRMDDIKEVAATERDFPPSPGKAIGSAADGKDAAVAAEPPFLNELKKRIGQGAVDTDKVTTGTLVDGEGPVLTDRRNGYRQDASALELASKKSLALSLATDSAEKAKKKGKGID